MAMGMHTEERRHTVMSKNNKKKKKKRPRGVGGEREGEEKISERGKRLCQWVPIVYGYGEAPPPKNNKIKKKSGRKK